MASIEPPTPAVTIAIPVHNGGEEFGRCLESICEQTFHDFRVIIFENASTDGTVETATRVASVDGRFEIRRSDRLLPVQDNFRRAIREGSVLSKYFCLRAADDFTSPNYLELLVDLLERDPSRSLAVTSVVKVSGDGHEQEIGEEQVLRVLDRSQMPNWSTKFPASWFYGLYRCGAATDYLLRSLDLFPYPWGCDRLVVYKMLSDFGVAYSRGAVFFCRLGSGSSDRYMPQSLADALRRRLIYFRACMAMDAHRPTRGLQRNFQSFCMAWRVAGNHTSTTFKQLTKSLRKSKGTR
jgi:glycosyltransferase involved in cell wall biosynthesis